MLENYSKREKLLVMIVGSLLPIFLIYLAGNSFTQSYFEKRAEKNRLQTRVNREKQKQLEGDNASQRRRFYQTKSMPTGDSNDQNDTNGNADEYKIWLQRVAKQVGMTNTSAKPLASRPGIFQGEGVSELVYNAYPVTLHATGTLDQLQEFLFQFYKSDLLHRINSLRITPKAAGTTAAQAKTRSGKFGLELKVEVVSLVDAEPTGEFLNRLKSPEFDLDHYSSKIIARNIFGPANNPPIPSVRDKSVEFGKPIKVSVRASDLDKNQKLKFELENPIHGATIKQLSPSSKTATVQFDEPLEVGEYGPFKVVITDDGLPAKSTTAEFMVNVTPERVAKKEVKTIYKHAKDTYINSVLRDAAGDWRVWIKVRTLGDKYNLKQGEKFRLDDTEWVVHEIKSRNHVVLKRGSQLLTFENGSSLSAPSSSVEMASTAVTSAK